MHPLLNLDVRFWWMSWNYWTCLYHSMEHTNSLSKVLIPVYLTYLQTDTHIEKTLRATKAIECVAIISIECKWCAPVLWVLFMRFSPLFVFCVNGFCEWWSAMANKLHTISCNFTFNLVEMNRLTIYANVEINNCIEICAELVRHV